MALRGTIFTMHREFRTFSASFLDGWSAWLVMFGPIFRPSSKTEDYRYYTSSEFSEEMKRINPSLPFHLECLLAKEVARDRQYKNMVRISGSIQLAAMLAAIVA